MVEASIKKKELTLKAFQENVTRSVVCDKCLQPIDAAHSSQSLLQLKAELAITADERDHVVKVRVTSYWHHMYPSVCLKLIEYIVT